VFVFDDRVEIISPGKLPNSLTVEDVKYGNPVIRNNQIVAFGIHALPFSGLGTGLRRSLAIQPNIELINDVEGEQFIVKIPRPSNNGEDPPPL
jgi:predicted HTH transcriptional regulator